ncbi:MAG TPA: hypothetical protein VEI58_04670 [Chthoniobacterales bacterium]|nr:hypothetical protein [Chthoniobacterales bacterium]
MIIDQETFERLLPAAYEWAKTQEDFVLARGVPVTSRQADDARRAGVQDCSRVRILVVDRIPLPGNLELAEAARLTQIISDDSHGVALGYAVIIRADCWGDRELLVHNFVHVAQCERNGGLEAWVRKYLGDRRGCAQFTMGELEDEARNLAREICSSNKGK